MLEQLANNWREVAAITMAVLGVGMATRDKISFVARATWKKLTTRTAAIPPAPNVGQVTVGVKVVPLDEDAEDLAAFKRLQKRADRQSSAELLAAVRDVGVHFFDSPKWNPKDAT
jgi:hypothetical protein